MAISEQRQALLDKANDLGLEFKGNISNVKLKQMIADAEDGDVITDIEPPAVEDTQFSAPVAVKEQEPEEETAVTPVSKRTKRLNFIQQRKAEAMKKRVVTITNKDNRDNDFTTTAHLSVENQFFGVAKNVPLDIPVELEQCLIDVAESTMITQHRDEIIDGRRTGNKTAVLTKKYVISYAKE